MWIYILVGTVILIGGYFIGTHHSLIGTKNKIEEWALLMEICMKNRYEILIKLIGLIRLDCDEELSKDLIEIENKQYDKLNSEAKREFDESITMQSEKIVLLIKDSESLKSDERYNQLITQLETVEEEKQKAKSKYNAQIKVYNDKIKTMPSSSVAKIFGFEEKKLDK